MTDTINLQHHRSLSHPDRMAGDYTRLSPYCYCANNPVNIIDPDGNSVTADDKSIENIKNTLTAEECSYIMFKDGVLDANTLNKCKSKSNNMIALKSLANSELDYIFISSDCAIDGTEFYNTKPDGNYSYGLTLMPHNKKNPSPDDKIYICVGNMLSEEQQALTTAHEAFGHAYFYEITRNPIEASHKYLALPCITLNPYTMHFEAGSIKKTIDRPIERQIKVIVEEAYNNYHKLWEK